MSKNFIKSSLDPIGDLEYTTDHLMIRRWVTDRHGHPAQMKKGKDAGNAERSSSRLRIHFSKQPKDDSLEAISWNEFFERFEEEHLAMQFLDEPFTGKSLPIVKLVNRATVEADDAALTGSQFQTEGHSGDSKVLESEPQQSQQTMPSRIPGESEGDALQRGATTWNQTPPGGPKIEEGGTEWTPDIEGWPG